MNVKLVLSVEDLNLTGYIRLVAFEAALHSDRGRTVRMGQAEMATHIGISRITVCKAFRNLEELGLLERMRHGRYRFSTEVQIDDSQEIPVSRGAMAEMEHLEAIKKPYQWIAFRKDGWPVLEGEQ